jgi:hypothetical protein
MLGQRAFRLLLPASKAASLHLHGVLGRESLRSTVCHSVGVAANVIAAAAAGGGSTATAAHAAVTNTIAQVAVTAVAIASGACLSTKVDFLWPQPEDQPGYMFRILLFV